MLSVGEDVEKLELLGEEAGTTHSLGKRAGPFLSWTCEEIQKFHPHAMEIGIYIRQKTLHWCQVRNHLSSAEWKKSYGAHSSREMSTLWLQRKANVSNTMSEENSHETYALSIRRCQSRRFNHPRRWRADWTPPLRIRDEPSVDFMEFGTGGGGGATSCNQSPADNKGWG